VSPNSKTYFIVCSSLKFADLARFVQYDEQASP